MIDAALIPIRWPDERQFARVAGLVLEARHRLVSAPAPWRPDASAAEIVPLRGGLESAAVARVTVPVQNAERRRRVAFVIKRLQGDTVREASIYGWLAASGCAHFAPACLAIVPAPDGGQWLFLEALTPVARWPWRHLVHVAGAVDALAALHESASVDTFEAHVREGEYDIELSRQSRATHDTFEVAARAAEHQWLRRYAPALRRLTHDVSALRRQSERAGLPAAVLHGDVHSRNLLVCRRGGQMRTVFADWTRARRGSPLEDLSSWLHSLAFWDEETRRRHDTLLMRYLQARGLRDGCAGAIRDAYWLASASNALAGALDYHLRVMQAPTMTMRQRETARRAARDWLRIITRADAIWRM